MHMYVFKVSFSNNKRFLALRLLSQMDGGPCLATNKQTKKNAHLAPANRRRQTASLTSRVGQQLCDGGKLAVRGWRPMRSGRRFGVYKHGGGGGGGRRHLAEQQCCFNKDN